MNKCYVSNDLGCGQRRFQWGCPGITPSNPASKGVTF